MRWAVKILVSSQIKVKKERGWRGNGRYKWVHTLWDDDAVSGCGLNELYCYLTNEERKKTRMWERKSIYLEGRCGRKLAEQAVKLFVPSYLRFHRATTRNLSRIMTAPSQLTEPHGAIMEGSPRLSTSKLPHPQVVIRIQLGLGSLEHIFTFPPRLILLTVTVATTLEVI